MATCNLVHFEESPIDVFRNASTVSAGDLQELIVKASFSFLDASPDPNGQDVGW